MLSVYTRGYFRPVYIRRSNVSVPAGSGSYTLSSVVCYLGEKKYKSNIVIYYSDDKVGSGRCPVMPSHAQARPT